MIKAGQALSLGLSQLVNLSCLLASGLVSASAQVPAALQYLLVVCHAGFADPFALLCVFTPVTLQKLRMFLFPEPRCFPDPQSSHTLTVGKQLSKMVGFLF